MRMPLVRIIDLENPEHRDGSATSIDDLATLITTLRGHFRTTGPHHREHSYGPHRGEK
jgi:hypothetical protein